MKKAFCVEGSTLEFLVIHLSIISSELIVLLCLLPPDKGTRFMYNIYHCHFIRYVLMISVEMAEG